jgi:16S rRNA processing protein RimM
LSAPFGVQGWLRLHAFGDDPQSWQVIKDWRVSADADAPAGQWSTLKLAGFKLQNTGPVVRFEGCDDRNAAESWSVFTSQRCVRICQRPARTSITGVI